MLVLKGQNPGQNLPDASNGKSRSSEAESIDIHHGFMSTQAELGDTATLEAELDLPL